jgi:hypothetical protein
MNIALVYFPETSIPSEKDQGFFIDAQIDPIIFTCQVKIRLLNQKNVQQMGKLQNMQAKSQLIHLEKTLQSRCNLSFDCKRNRPFAFISNLQR